MLGCGVTNFPPTKKRMESTESAEMRVIRFILLHVKNKCRTDKAVPSGNEPQENIEHRVRMYATLTEDRDKVA